MEAEGKIGLCRLNVMAIGIMFHLNFDSQTALRAFEASEVKNWFGKCHVGETGMAQCIWTTVILQTMHLRMFVK